MHTPGLAKSPPHGEGHLDDVQGAAEAGDDLNYWGLPWPLALDQARGGRSPSWGARPGTLVCWAGAGPRVTCPRWPFPEPLTASSRSLWTAILM